MKNRLTTLFMVACASSLTSCAVTSLKQTWKSPEYTGGPVGTVALLTVTEEGLVRAGLENRFARELGRTGQPVVRTHELLSLPDIEEDRLDAVKRLREAGAQTVLITRLISSETQARSVRVGEERYAPVATGFSPGMPYGAYDWYGYYTVAFQDMGTVWNSQTKRVYIETSLFDLADGHRLWSCVTKSVLKDTTDRVAEMNPLVDLIVTALRKDGLVK